MPGGARIADTANSRSFQSITTPHSFQDSSRLCKFPKAQVVSLVRLGRTSCRADETGRLKLAGKSSGAAATALVRAWLLPRPPLLSVLTPSQNGTPTVAVSLSLGCCLRGSCPTAPTSRLRRPSLLSRRPPPHCRPAHERSIAGEPRFGSGRESVRNLRGRA